jgi:cob(I)alamin adenosyltransferase
VKIYTRTGDTGETALFGGGRVRKTHLRVEAYGTVDELNAVVGRALAAMTDADSRARLRRVQHDLFALGAHLATPPTPEGKKRPRLPSLPTDRVAEMEAWMDEATEELPELKGFILPGGSPGAAELHVCRTVCRRAERAVVALLVADSGQGQVSVGDPEEEAVRYLNRLSDLLFVLARLENLRAGADDVAWQKEEGG